MSFSAGQIKPSTAQKKVLVLVVKTVPRINHSINLKHVKLPDVNLPDVSLHNIYPHVTLQ